MISCQLIQVPQLLLELHICRKINSSYISVVSCYNFHHSKSRSLQFALAKRTSSDNINVINENFSDLKIVT